MDEIVNRVANSSLITIDLEDWFPKEITTTLDISDWLFQGLILKEKDFRESVKQHNWSQYKDQVLFLICATDAIIPSWAYMLITLSASSFTSKVYRCSYDTYIQLHYQNVMDSINVDEFKNKPVIIKGCSKKPVPETAYLSLIQKLAPFVKSILFGEACSSVPLYKQSK